MEAEPLPTNASAYHTVTLISRSQKEIPETMLGHISWESTFGFSEKEEKQSREDVEDGDEEREELKGDRQRMGEDSEKGSVCGGRGLNMSNQKSLFFRVELMIWFHHFPPVGPWTILVTSLNSLPHLTIE